MFDKIKQKFSPEAEGHEKNALIMAIFKSAYFVGLLLYGVVIGQLFVTLSLPIEVRSDRVEVYLRNGSSILCFALLAQYLLTWCAFNVEAITSQRQMKWFKVLTFAGGVVSLAKGILSILFFVNQMNRGIEVAVYYSSDVIVWIAMAIFYFGYWNIKLTPTHPIKWFNPNFKALTSVVVYFFLFKAVASSYYTAIRFNTYGIAWTFFLYDAIAWLFLAAFFAAYTRSELVTMKMAKTKDEKSDDVSTLCEKAAKLKYKKRKFYDID